MPGPHKNDRVKDFANEWKRTDPDLAVYRPQAERGFDSYSVHFLVTRTPAGSWLKSRA